MNKKTVLIILIGFIVLAAAAVVLLSLRPMQNAQGNMSPEFNNAWKLERIQGVWASEDGKYALDVDGSDFTLRIDNFFAIIASILFDDSETPQEDNVRFTLKIDSSTAMRLNEEVNVSALWYEDGMIYMRLSAPEGEQAEPVCFVRIESSLPAWSLDLN